MQKDHPDIMAVREPRGELHRAFEPREGRKPACAETPADPEANDVSDKAAEPADRDKRAETERTGRRGVAGEQSNQKHMRGGIAEHEAVRRIAVLANEIEERGEVRRKQQWGFTLEFRLAQSRCVSISAQCPLLGVKRTSRGFVAIDPSGHRDC